MNDAVRDDVSRETLSPSTLKPGDPPGLTPFAKAVGTRPESLETLGERLAWAQSLAEVSNVELAHVVQRAPETVSQWRRGFQVPDDDALRAAAAYLSNRSDFRIPPGWIRYGGPLKAARDAEDLATRATPTGAPPQSEPPIDWPQSARVFAREFELEAVRQGASEADADYIRRVLFSPESYVMYAGGRSRVLSEDEVMKQMTALAEGLRAWLKARKRLR
jgi:transcriptional regulator with XRE-family HTH domain